MTFEPRSWGNSFADFTDLRSRLLQEATQNPEGALEAASRLLKTHNLDTFEKQYIPQIGVEVALTCGLRGVELLTEITRSPARPLIGSAAIEGMWAASNGQPFPIRPIFEKRSIFPEVREVARAALDDLIVESQSDDDLFHLLLTQTGIGSLGRISALMNPELPDFARHLMKVHADSSIRLTERTLARFDDLLQEDGPEFIYQDFLRENPVLLNPLAAEVIPQAKMGLEFITDFTLRLHNGSYTLVEIERPRDRIFTRADDLTSRFNHAVGQVLDFQTWISENSAYAAKHFPGISAPHGVVIMGMRSQLNGRQLSKLKRWQHNSREITHMTYDDLLHQGRTLLKSLRKY
ncbi:Shedu anti-phage system protein SduA domain-containing protein [Streptomyces rimosus]